MKKYASAICLLFFIIGIVILYVKIDDAASIPTPHEAKDYLNDIFVSERTTTPRSSAGVYLPNSLPYDYFEIHAYGRKNNSDEIIDMLNNVELIPETWLLLSDLQEYCEVTIVMGIYHNGIALAERRVDVLN